MQDENEVDIAIYDARKAELESGRDARLPSEASAAMLRGDSLLKALRKWRNATQQGLAEKTGLGQGYISDLEVGRRKGAKETTRLLAKALDVDESWLAD